MGDCRFFFGFAKAEDPLWGAGEGGDDVGTSLMWSALKADWVWGVVAERATKVTSPAGADDGASSAEEEDEAVEGFRCFAAGWGPVAKDTPPEGGAKWSSVVAGEEGRLTMVVSGITA